MTRPDYVLALDPGLTTGWALYRLDAEGGPAERPEIGELGMMEMSRAIDNTLRALRDLGYEVVVVCERFIINEQTIRNPQAPWSLEMIGIARWLAHEHGFDYVLQMSADAKKMVTNDRLRALDWWARGKEHGRDATRHLVFYLVEADFLTKEQQGKLFTLD